MKQRCGEAIWWPAIDRRVEDLVRSCEACTLSEKTQPRPAPLQPTPWPKKPWQQLQVDIFGEVQAAPQSQRFLLVVHDLHSKWPEIAATSSVTTTSVISILEKMFTKWGLPESITTDNGPQFTSEQFEEFLAVNGIQHRLTTRYNPQSNGGVERFNRVIKESLKANLADGMTFDKAIQTLLRTYRSTPHSLTGKTPAELMLGRNLRMPFNILKPPVSEPASTQAEAREIERKQQSMKAYTDKRRRAITPNIRYRWLGSCKASKSQAQASFGGIETQTDREEARLECICTRWRNAMEHQTPYREQARQHEWKRLGRHLSIPYKHWRSRATASRTANCSSFSASKETTWISTRLQILNP